MENERLHITVIRMYRACTEICLNSGFKFNLANGDFAKFGLKQGDFVYNDTPKNQPANTILLTFTPPAPPPTRAKGTICVTNGVVHKIIFADETVSEMLVPLAS